MPDLTALQRQRRFLILMCLAVIAFYAFGAKVRDNVEYSGFAVVLTEPSRVLVGLWLVWAWALIRYAQRVYELAHDIWVQLLQDVHAEDQRIALGYATRYARRLAKKGSFNERDRENVRVAGRVRMPVGADEARRMGANTLPDVVPTAEGGRKYERLHLVLRWGTADEPGIGNQPFLVEMSKTRVRWLRVRAWLYGMLGLPAFSEHIAPALLAVATPFAPLVFR